MKRIGATIILIILAGILPALAQPTLPAQAQGSQATLRFYPPTLRLQPGIQGRINIRAENVQELYGLEFQLTFDPGVIEVIDADPDQEGIQIGLAEWWKDGFVAVNHVDNDIGRIDFAATLLRPAQPVSGTREIAAILFAARKTGASTLRIESAILSTRNAEAIPRTIQAGKIVVNATDQLPLESANIRSAGPAPGQLALAGAAILAFFVALGVFIYALLRR